jgi:hypothetical protein
MGGSVPVTYEIDSERRLVRTRCAGAVTFAEVLAHFDELERDPARPEQLDVILDLTGSATLPESDQLRAVAARVGEVRLPRFERVAIVADRDSMFGMARMFEVFAEAHFGASRVFRQAEEAERWLAEAGDRE